MSALRWWLNCQRINQWLYASRKHTAPSASTCVRCERAAFSRTGLPTKIGPHSVVTPRGGLNTLLTSRCTYTHHTLHSYSQIHTSYVAANIHSPQALPSRNFDANVGLGTTLPSASTTYASCT